MSIVEEKKKNTLINVEKRDGSQVSFDIQKIITAIEKVGNETKEFDIEEAAIIANEVVVTLCERANGCIPKIEDIQSIVEYTLFQRGLFTSARAYIVYREKHAEIRKNFKCMVDVIDSTNQYLDRKDWRVNANANQGYSLGGLILNSSGKLTANYWLSHVYSPQIGAAHREGDFHIHDLDILAGYCAGWSLRVLLEEGFNGVPGKVEASAPRHMSSAIGQIVNFLGTLQNEWAGAQAFSSFDTYMAPFVRKDSMTYEDVKQNIQELIFNLNIPSRWGTQTPFTNLTFDWTCPEDLKDKHPIIGNKEMEFTYGSLEKEMGLINRAYMEIMISGDAKGRVFTFPIPTYNITDDFLWDSENANLLFDMTAKYGLPYFQNFINSELKPNMIRSMCCRLQLDLRELLKRGNGLFGSAEQTGSLGVVTINCARLGYRFAGHEKELMDKLCNLLDLAKESLELKRKIIQMYMDNGLYPYTKRYLGTLRNHFSTIGVNGINEMIRNFTKDCEDITTEWGFNFACKILDYIRNKITSFQEESGHLYNLEATPAESTTYRFAKEDKKRFPNIIHAGTNDNPYYTNSSQLPVGFTDDPFEALDRQDILQRKYTGGTVLHLYMNERISSGEVCKQIVKKALQMYKLPYITITPTFSICHKHGYLKGEQEYCPTCDDILLNSNGILKNEDRTRCEVWTRVMGYLRPVDSFNIGKKGEYNERVFFTEDKTCCQ